ncbi:substrate-binding domain-containing protein [Acidisoma silvae]|uniref:Substrate-binding domain-containing protein n=1 Tax=Acidisoma silvae TaxID=2802396 RepID=A0A963YSI5_9PROT|nr:substrate-binding domain-containing protein [Acidisoma silvae]MCB8876171.1 substrate-binding domain-containing protein [Acidisoma silvae]
MSSKFLKILLAGVALSVGTAGAAPAFADAKNPVIGFTVYDMSSFISLGKRGVEAVAKANNATLLWNSAGMDVNAQISQFQQFINRKVDAIVVAPVNSATLTPQIKAAKEAGIAVIVTNLTASPDATPYLTSYVGPDDVMAGANEAKHMMTALGSKGNVVVLQGPLGQSGEIDRTKGIKQVLAQNPNVTVLAIQPGNWARNQAYSITQDWLSRYGSKIDGIIAENDDMAIGAIQALKEKGLAGKIPVTGTDGIKDGMRAVRDGTELESNLQDGPLELGMAEQVAINHVQGKPVPATAMFIMPELTKANVDHYYTQMYGDFNGFLKTLPALINANLASGNYGNQ